MKKGGKLTMKNSFQNNSFLLSKHIYSKDALPKYINLNTVSKLKII